MARRRLLGLLPVAALAMCAWTGCKGGKKTQASAEDFKARCAKVAKTCGDTDKHAERITAECQQAADKLVELGCVDKTIAVYDCYEKELCGKGDKVWAIDDLRVLAERHGKCAAERTAVRECVTKAK